MDSPYPTRKERLKEVTDKLEAGVTELFEGERFADYLRTMSKFHDYSFGNILLIAMQFPDASQVAGFHDWRKKFGRSVKKGEKGIRILAPCIFEAVEEREKLDPVTHRPMVDSNGKPIVEHHRIEAKAEYEQYKPIQDDLRRLQQVKRNADTAIHQQEKPERRISHKIEKAI